MERQHPEVWTIVVVNSDGIVVEYSLGSENDAVTRAEALADSENWSVWEGRLPMQVRERQR